ncbi:MAG: tyrosine-type recombinase/integrase, partial [Candidatus Limnocylindrus sp.]
MSGGRRAAPVTRGGASALDPRVATFMQHLAARTLSGATARSYRTVVERFLEWSDGEGVDWRKPARADLRRYVARLGGGAQRSTVQQRLAALGTFYRFWVRQGSVPSDPLHALARPQRERRLPDVLSADQVSRLIDTAASGEPVEFALRDAALIELLYGAGLRIAEVVSIDVRDLDLVRGEVRITGKGDKERIALFGSPCVNALQRYLA